MKSLPMFTSKYDGMMPNRKFIEMGGILRDFPTGHSELCIMRGIDGVTYELHSNECRIGIFEDYADIAPKLQEMINNVEEDWRRYHLQGLLARILEAY